MLLFRNYFGTFRKSLNKPQGLICKNEFLGEGLFGAITALRVAYHMTALKSKVGRSNDN